MRSTLTRAASGLAGLLLLSWVIHRTGAHQIATDIGRLGWGLALVIAIGGVPHMVKTWAWRLTLLQDRSAVSFGRMLSLRLGSEALGQLGVIGTVFGDGLRASLLGTKIPAATGIVSVALDRTLFVVSAALTIAMGTAAAVLLFHVPHRVAVAVDIFSMAMMILMAAGGWAVKKRMLMISATARALARIPALGNRISAKSCAIERIEQQLFNFFHEQPAAFCASLALNFACHAAAVLEVWLVLMLLGTTIGFRGALSIEALTKLINSIGAFTPGGIGAYEGGNMLIGKLFAFGASTGLALAFARRARGIFWTIAGALCLISLPRPGRRSAASVTASPAEPQPIAVAVILADGLFKFDAAVANVGEVPVLLRAILGLRKAGFTRIVVIVDPLRRPHCQRHLQRSRRLPDSVEWWDTVASLPAVIAGAHKVAFVAGDRTYHSALLREMAAWDGKTAGMAISATSTFSGACVLSNPLAREFAASLSSGFSALQQLGAWVAARQDLEHTAAPENRWQLIRNEQERLAAEKKLDQWLVKPTDGIFARFNRTISIPISRQLIRFPITPNMVSLFTLGVSFLSGFYFAMGGYLNMLLGALLGVFASILDGCDGEVARLKLQESEFGCWLETVCDYLYYLFMFAGMTIGLLRTTGTRSYLYLGCLLLTGAVLSFLTTAMQRSRLTAAGRPEQLLGNWQKEAERRRSNPFLFAARHTEFIVRRCFLPYAILVFAVLQILPVAFVLAAAGANVVWPIALYSCLTFPSPQKSAA